MIECGVFVRVPLAIKPRSESFYKAKMPHKLRNRFLLGFVVLNCLLLAGCSSAAFTVAYLFKGPEVEPDCKILLKGEKKAVVVCRATSLSQHYCETVPKELSEQVSVNIVSHVKNKKLKVLPQRKVEEWLDNGANQFEDFTEIGKSLHSDVVIGIELQHFAIQDNPNLLQGRAVVLVKAFDCKDGALLFSRTLPEIVYPPNSFINAREKSASEFRREFVTIVAAHVSCLFHKHDPRNLRRIDADAL